LATLPPAFPALLDLDVRSNNFTSLDWLAHFPGARSACASRASGSLDVSLSEGTLVAVMAQTWSV
jgi:hypothetical protein